MQSVTLAGSAGSAMLTIGLAVYAALILASIAVLIDSARRGLRRRAIIAAVVAGLLTVSQVVIAILSSVTT
ncbi:hypothetical protein [uncultured Mycolicibacterium sp.]|uniref:hypothetical protein n=1 Tax=uncultured Mycolicibacterium sp. TaxID=2320817 RepID=UPI0026100935|nr:hypothetical protein [uncultured Mycolicibacterium sp.]